MKYDFPFVSCETPPIRAKIASDLDRIVDCIKQDFPNATVVLGGSFSYGEGSVREDGDRIVSRSDYDIYLILRSPIQVVSALKDKKLRNINSGLGLQDGFSVDLKVIWEGLIHLGLTAISGKAIHGNSAVGKLIDRMPISKAKLSISYLKMAYLGLIEILSGNGPADDLQDVLIRGFRSFLGLMETRAEMRESWKDYFSLRTNMKMLDKYREDLKPDLREWIRSALMSKLDPGKTPLGITPQSIALTKELLDGLFSRTKRTFLWTDYLQYLVHRARERRVPNFFLDPNRVMLEASYHLLNAIRGNGKIDESELEKAKKILQTMIPWENMEQDKACFAWCKEKIATLAYVSLHKIKEEETPLPSTGNPHGRVVTHEL